MMMEPRLPELATRFKCDTCSSMVTRITNREGILQCDKCCVTLLRGGAGMGWSDIVQAQLNAQDALFD